MGVRRFGVACLVVGLLAAGAAVSADRDLRLIQAIKADDRPTVKRLAASGVDVNAPAGDGSTALHWSAQNGDAAVADLLIRKGAKVNATNDLGVTPLWVAANTSNTAIVERLLAAHADPNIAPATGRTPLMLAARRGDAPAVKALLAHGADPNARETAHGQTALMWAVAGRHPDAVRLLLSAHADVRARTRSWMQQVLLCCQLYGGDKETAATVAMGGFTPILFAAQYGDVETTRLLLAAGADANDAAADHSSAVVIAAHVGRSEVAAALLDAGADANAAGSGYTALHIASARGDIALVRALLAHGADPNARVQRGSPSKRIRSGHALDQRMIGATPFVLAAYSGQLETMKLLAAHGADPSIPLQDGRTGLMALGGQSTTEGPDLPPARMAEVVKLAVQLGAPVNQAGANGDTALHVAAAWRRDEMVQALVDSGAALDARNHDGETPLGAALRPPAQQKGSVAADDFESLVKHTATADLLRKLGAKT
ncbi:MAG TPA: ankyrin repeat domain-containing protein [Caulobacteraceae bacterium]|nr:ankyrin repeat domain-containing protein [Caulobacteraceae bacterium]